MKGIVRDSGDSVRMVSYMFSTYVEATALQPKAPFVGAAGAFDGFGAGVGGCEQRQPGLPRIQHGRCERQPCSAAAALAAPDGLARIMQGLMLAKDALKDTSALGAALWGRRATKPAGKPSWRARRKAMFRPSTSPTTQPRPFGIAAACSCNGRPRCYDEAMVCADHWRRRIGRQSLS